MAVSRLHHAYFYKTDQELADRLAKIVLDDLREKRLVMVFLTLEHKNQLEEALRKNGFDVHEDERAAGLKILDAVMLKSRLVEGEILNEDRFNATFASLLREGAEANKEITVCGEIVNLLWNEGNCKAAVALEKLWDDILVKHNLNIHCAYAAPSNDLRKAAFKPIDSFHFGQVS